MPGIIDFDVKLPRFGITVQEMHARSGVAVDEIRKITVCEKIHALRENEPSWELAAAAGRMVLDRTQVDPAAIRQVIYTGSGQWDRPIWTPAARTAHELGIEHAHCFELTNACNSAMTAVQIAMDSIAVGRSEYVLVLMGERLSSLVDYDDAEASDAFNIGDAGAAILVGDGDHAFTHLRSSMRTDPSWSDHISGEYRDNKVFIRNNGHRKGLSTAYIENYVARVNDTLRGLDRTLADVAYLLVSHTDANIHRRLLNTIGLPEEKSVFNYHRFGHMGGVDTLIALRDLMTENRLRPGDLVLLATSARGFSWGITALEYRN